MEPPIPAVRRHKVNQINVLEKSNKSDIIRCEYSTAKFNETMQKPILSNLIRNSPVVKIKKPTSPMMKKNTNHEQINNIQMKRETLMLSDDDDFYTRLTYVESEQSLEDEIFEELEKVAHDEAKLYAAIQNFDKILKEFNGKEKEHKNNKKFSPKKDEKPSAIPKLLQKSKTCSIIDSKCILKVQETKLNASKHLKLENDKSTRVDNSESNTGANCYQLTKSLWSLDNFDRFTKEKIELGSRKSDGSISVKNFRKSEVPSINPSPEYKRQSSISKIPIKSTKRSLSMLQLNSLSSTESTQSEIWIKSKISSSVGLNKITSAKTKKSPIYASNLELSTSNKQIKNSSMTPTKNSLHGLVNHSSTRPKIIYAESTGDLRKGNMISSSISMNKLPTNNASSINQTTTNGKSLQLKSAKSEISFNRKFISKVNDRPKQQQKHQYLKTQQKNDVKNSSPINTKSKRDGDGLLNKCLVKGQELLRKERELNESNKKRDYIAKQQLMTSTTIKILSKSDVRMNKKTGSILNVNDTHHDNNNINTSSNLNAITDQLTVDNRESKELMQRKFKSEKSVNDDLSTRKLASKNIIISVNDKATIPTLESSPKVIPDVLGEKTAGLVSDEALIDKNKDYNSDCSEDSGHISNENEEVTEKMNIKKPKKISDELLGVFEKKPQKNFEPETKAKVIEQNMIKTSMKIYPTFNKTCKSEVTIFVNKY